MTAKASSKIIGFKHVVVYAAYILVVWGFYRFLFRLPDNFEEMVVKPILWLMPIALFLCKEGKKLSSIGITFKNLFPALYLALGLGAIFALEALLINYLKYGQLTFNTSVNSDYFLATIGLSFATAFSEEIAFRGYIFSRVWETLKSEWLANIIVSFFWTVIHIPITVFVLKLGLTDTLIYLFLSGVFGLGSAFVFARTKNVFSSVFLHVLWEWPIILFR